MTILILKWLLITFPPGGKVNNKITKTGPSADWLYIVINVYTFIYIYFIYIYLHIDIFICLYIPIFLYFLCDEFE